MPVHSPSLLPTGIGEYLEAIYKLGEQEAPVPVPALADRLEVTPTSANEMVRRLADRGLATYEPYKGVSLTEEGRHQALVVIRRHRLWERLLTDILHVPWDQVHEEACRLEHATSPQLEEHLSRALEGASSCPHGSPMPDADGTILEPVSVPLVEVVAGQRGTVLRVPEEDAALLRHLDDVELRPGAEVTVVSVAPYQGPITYMAERGSHILGHELAGRIMVRVGDGEDE